MNLCCNSIPSLDCAPNQDHFDCISGLCSTRKPLAWNSRNTGEALDDAAAAAIAVMLRLNKGDGRRTYVCAFRMKNMGIELVARSSINCLKIFASHLGNNSFVRERQGVRVHNSSTRCSHLLVAFLGVRRAARGRWSHVQLEGVGDMLKVGTLVTGKRWDAGPRAPDHL